MILFQIGFVGVVGDTLRSDIAIDNLYIDECTKSGGRLEDY